MENLRAAILESRAVVTHGPLPLLMANGSQLQQVFQNLIGNALKFEGPKTPAIQISASKEGARHGSSTVADNGIGAAARPRLRRECIHHFQPPAHSKPDIPGNGIGLAICKKIVQQHGGSIQAVPQNSDSAIFNFALAGGAT